MTISFQNPGIIDIQAAMTFGVSAKVTNNPIGYFGTGLKYAIAVILRNGGKVTINAGNKTHTFTLAKRDSRGTEYNEVLMSGKSLHFSTNLGRNWKAWQAFRELYCNTKDEQGEVVNRPLRGRPGFTTIVVSGWEEFDRAFEERNKFFIAEDRRPIFSGSYCEVYEGETNGIYYRGILVGTLPEGKMSKFTYNLRTYVALTEDRTMQYPHQFGVAVACAAMYMGSNKNLLEDILTAGREYNESQLPFSQCGLDPSEDFLDTVMNLRSGPRAGLVSMNAIDLLNKARPVTDDTEAVKLTDAQQKDLATALGVLERRFPDIRSVPLIPVSTLGAGVYGLARRGKMYIALRCFEAGLTQLIGTIFEEYSHVTKDFRDESRDFQNYLINLVAIMLEEKHGGDVRSSVDHHWTNSVACDATGQAA